MTTERIKELEGALKYAISIIEDLNSYAADMCDGGDDEDGSVAACEEQIEYLKSKLEAK